MMAKYKKAVRTAVICTKRYKITNAKLGAIQEKHECLQWEHGNLAKNYEELRRKHEEMTGNFENVKEKYEELFSKLCAALRHQDDELEETEGPAVMEGSAFEERPDKRRKKKNVLEPTFDDMPDVPKRPTTRSKTRASSKNVLSVFDNHENFANVPGPSQAPQVGNRSPQIVAPSAQLRNFSVRGSRPAVVYQGPVGKPKRRPHSDIQFEGRRHGRLLEGSEDAKRHSCHCGRYFKIAANFERHLNEKIRGTITCNQVGCGKPFSLERDANNHQQKCHGTPNVVCMGCQQFFPSKEMLKEHQRQSGCKTQRIQTGLGYPSIRVAEFDFQPNLGPI